jgi:hypothetical protein
MWVESALAYQDVTRDRRSSLETEVFLKLIGTEKVLLPDTYIEALLPPSPVSDTRNI